MALLTAKVTVAFVPPEQQPLAAVLAARPRPPRSVHPCDHKTPEHAVGFAVGPFFIVPRSRVGVAAGAFDATPFRARLVTE
jgi:hypothetical protein